MTPLCYNIHNLMCTDTYVLMNNTLPVDVIHQYNKQLSLTILIILIKIPLYDVAISYNEQTTNIYISV